MSSPDSSSGDPVPGDHSPVLQTSNVVINMTAVNSSLKDGAPTTELETSEPQEENSDEAGKSDSSLIIQKPTQGSDDGPKIETLLDLASLGCGNASRLAWTSFVTYWAASFRFYRKHPHSFRKEILSGLTVTVLQVPESVAFSYVAGVDPLSGLYATVFMGFITGLLGGCPGMISGAAGALAVVAKDITADDGPLKSLTDEQRFNHLLMVMILCGVFQMLAGFLNLAKFVSIIPETSMIGFLNGLAIIIFMAQFTSFQTCDPYELFGKCKPAERGWMSFASSELWMVFLLIAITLSVMHFFPKIPKVGKVLPASLVALLFCTGFEHGIIRGWWGLATRTVGETAPLAGGLPDGFVPEVDWGNNWGVILQYAFTLGFIGLIESLITLQACDQLLKKQFETVRANQECVAQGIANFICGFFGAMGGDAMIGQSTINVMNGARGRLSATTSGIGMFIVIVVFSPVIEYIPIACFTGVVFMVVLHTFNWHTFRFLREAKPTDAFALVMVSILGVVADLAVAVVSGILWTAVCYIWDDGKDIRIRSVYNADDQDVELEPLLNDDQEDEYDSAEEELDVVGASPFPVNVVHKHDDDPEMVAAAKREEQQTGHHVRPHTKIPPGSVVHHISGRLFAASTFHFGNLFYPERDPKHSRIDMLDCRVMDFSALAALKALTKRYKEEGRTVEFVNVDSIGMNMCRRAKKYARKVRISGRVPTR